MTDIISQAVQNGESSQTPLLADADVDANHQNEAPAHDQPKTQIHDDGSVMGVPKETIEEMMRAWSKILIQGLRKKGHNIGRSEDVELGEISTVPAPTAMEDDQLHPIENREGVWDGGFVEVMTEEELRVEKEKRASRLITRTMLEDGFWTESWYGADDNTQIDSSKTRCLINGEIPRLKWPGTKVDLLKVQSELHSLLDDPKLKDRKHCGCQMKQIGIYLQKQEWSIQSPRNITLDEGRTWIYFGRRKDIFAYCSEITVVVRVVVIYLRLVRCYSHDLTLNRLLYACWRQGVFPQYKDDHLADRVPSWNYVVASVYVAIRGLACIDTLGICPILDDSYIGRSKYNFTRYDVEKDTGGSSKDGNQLLIKAARYLSVSPESIVRNSQAVADMRRMVDPSNNFYAPIVQEEAGGRLFRPADFHASLIQSVGGLEIRWTDCLDEHLHLFNLSDGMTERPVLKLYWFDSYASESASTLGVHRLRSQWREATGTTRLILCTQSDKEFAQSYRKIRLPKWYCASDVQPDPSGLKRGVIRPEHIICDHVGSHFARLAISTQVQYSSYPHYEKRLRQLKYYMDNQSPTGLRGLWRDKRNSYSFYTLWLVIIFGGISILLALLSLTVSAAQTSAAFHPPKE